MALSHGFSARKHRLCSRSAEPPLKTKQLCSSLQPAHLAAMRYLATAFAPRAPPRWIATASKEG